MTRKRTENVQIVGRIGCYRVDCSTVKSMILLGFPNLTYAIWLLDLDTLNGWEPA